MGLRLLRYSFLTAVATIGAGLAWLFWPLPDARFDWQEAAQVYIDNGRCGSLPDLLLSVAHVDPEALTAYLDGRSIGEICPLSPEEDDIALSEMGFTAYFDSKIAEVLLASPFAEANLRHRPMGLRPAFDGLMGGRSLRQQAGLGWFGWPEIVLNMRCEYPLFWSRQATWYRGRGSARVLFPAHGGEVALWEQRRAWCDRYANRQLQHLQSSIGDVVSYRTDEDAARQFLLTNYEAWAISYKRPGEMPPPE